MENFILGCIIAVFVVVFLVVYSLIGALCFAWAWNTVLPLLWAGAPHFGFWQGLASIVLLWYVKPPIAIPMGKASS